MLLALPASRPVFDTVDELLAGTVPLGEFHPVDARSPAPFRRVEVDGEACVVKFVHPDHDFAMRAGGDIGCLPLRAWATGLADLAPRHIDHATLGAARWGRNGWGAALLMRDVADELIPATDDPVPEPVHAACLDNLAALCAAGWGWRDTMGLLPIEVRWQFFSPQALGAEQALGFPEPVPRIATEGWERFAGLAPAGLVDAITALRTDASPLVDALLATPTTFIHGDWKFGNLGHRADGRTILLDWAYVGEGFAGHELAWYLALNRARLPLGHSKETTIADFRSALERQGVATAGWWDIQIDLCLLGALVQFGWEKAWGDAAELGWWIERAETGRQRL